MAVLAAAGAALVLALGGCGGGGQGSRSPAASHSTPPATIKRTAGAGGAVSGRAVGVGCSQAVYGSLPRGWRTPRRGALVAGPMAWLGVSGGARQSPDYRRSHGLAPAVKALAVVDPGRPVTVSVPAAERGRLSLDYTGVQPRAQTSGGSLFRVSDGASTVTFTPCPRATWPGGRTQFAGGFIVGGAQCAAIDVRAAASSRPIRRFIAFGVPSRRCGAAHRSTPGALRGVALRGRTGLRLLVAADPPFVLDVDTGSVTPVTGLDARGNPVLTVQAVGADAVVWLQRRGRAVRNAEIYVIRRGTTRARRIATGTQVAQADRGHAIWLLSSTATHRCALSERGLDGRVLRRPRPIACATRLLDTGTGAALVDAQAVLDPGTGRALLHSSATVWAVAHGRALTSDGLGPPLTLTDLRSARRWPLPWPSSIAATDQSGTDEAVAASGGRLLALDFADPAYRLTATQVFDVWLLNVVTRRFQHLPDMPAAIALKATSMAWAGHGRLVILAQTGGPGRRARSLVAVWRPGRRQLATRRVRLPARTSGSDSFVAWSAP